MALLHPVRRSTEVVAVAEVGHHREARWRGWWSSTSRLKKQKEGIKQAYSREKEFRRYAKGNMDCLGA